MPRAKRVQRQNETECRVCQIVFFAVRSDARYCGPTCRQKVSRAVRAAMSGGFRRGRKIDTHTSSRQNCGSVSQINAAACFVCETKFKKGN